MINYQKVADWFSDDWFSALAVINKCFCVCLCQMSLRWTQRGFLATNSGASQAAVNTSSVPSGSLRMSRPQPTTSSQRSFTSCSRPTLHDFSPTSSTSPASATLAGSWLERMVTTSPIWWENHFLLASIYVVYRFWSPRFYIYVFKDI